MKKAINFDIDTKKYEEYTGKPAPTAYVEIKKYLKRNGFEHRQGSGYISQDNTDYRKITDLITNMSIKYQWLQYCIKELDVTNITRHQHSLVNVVKAANQKKKVIESRMDRHNIDISKRKSDNYERE